MKAVGSPNAPSASRMAAATELPQLRRVVDPAHAAAATAGDRLDEDREADLLGAGDQFVQIGRGRGGLQRRNPAASGRLQRPDLVAGQFQHVGRRADEGDTGLDAGPGQIGILAQEPVAGIDRVRPGLLGRANDLGDVEIGADRMAAFADRVRLIGLDPVNRIAVLVRKHRDRLGAQLIRGPESTNSDLAPVGHQDLGEHGQKSIGSRFPAEDTSGREADHDLTRHRLHRRPEGKAAGKCAESLMSFTLARRGSAQLASGDARDVSMLDRVTGPVRLLDCVGATADNQERTAEQLGVPLRTVERLIAAAVCRWCMWMVPPRCVFD